MTSATGATSPEEARELHVAGIHSGVQRCPTVFRRRAHVRSGLQQPFSRAEVVVEAGVVQWLPAVLVSSGYLSASLGEQLRHLEFSGLRRHVERLASVRIRCLPHERVFLEQG